MNSAVKQLPRLPSRAFGRWACLASLLLAAPAFGQFIEWQAGTEIQIRDATTTPTPEDPNRSTPSQAIPYGVEIAVGSTTPGGATLRDAHTIQKVAVVLPNLSHSYFADLDVLLTGPKAAGGTGRVVLMSDVALNQGTSPATVPGGAFVNLVVDQSGGEFPVGISPAVSSEPTAYRPTNFETAVDEFSDVAGDAYATTLAEFNNRKAKDSSWKLYVKDDRVSDFGQLGRWKLRLWVNPIFTVDGKAQGEALAIDMKEDENKEVTIAIDDPDSRDTDFEFVIDSKNTAVIPNTFRSGGVSAGNAGFSVRKDGAVWKLALRANDNVNTAAPFNVDITLRDKRGSTVLGQVTFSTLTINKVEAVNDAPTIGKLFSTKADGVTPDVEVSKITANQGQLSANYVLEVNDADAADVASLQVYGLTGAPDLIASTDIFSAPFPGNNQRRYIRLAPRGEAPSGATGSGSFSILLRDTAGASSAGKSITFEATRLTDRHIRSNPASVNLTDGSTTVATSAMTVSGVTAQGISATIQSVTVTLADFSHQIPDDATVVLRGPNGRAVVLMDQVGGSGDVNADNRLRFSRLTFADGAAALPADGPIQVNGIAGETYRPLGTLAALPAGFPAAGDLRATLTEAFQGAPANGSWTLYVLDRGPSNGKNGVIRGGFVLDIRARPVIAGLPAADPAIAFNEDDGDRTVTLTLEDTDGRIKSSTVTEVVAGSAKLVLTDATKTWNTADVNDPVTHAFKFRPVGNAFGTTTLRTTVVDDKDYTTVIDRTVNIAAVNDQPTITEISKQTVWLGQVVTQVPFTVGDPGELIQGANVLTVTRTSDNIKLLPLDNIVITPGAVSGDFRTQAYTISLFPAAGETGVANITLTVTDSGQKADLTGTIPDTATRKSASTILRLEVNSEPSKTVSVVSPITINDGTSPPTKGNPYPSATSEVKDLTGVISSVKVNLYSLSSKTPEDVAIVLVKGTRAVVLMRESGGLNEVGGSSGRTPVQLRFNDAAPAGPIASGGTLTSGEFRPQTRWSGMGALSGVMPSDGVNWPGIDVRTTFREAFENQDPNGIWQLFVADLTSTGDGKPNGAIASWMLTIETKPRVTDIVTVNGVEDKDATFEVDLGDNQPGVFFLIEVVEESSPAAPEGSPVLGSFQIDPAALGDRRRITLKPAANKPRFTASTTARLRIDVQNAQGDTYSDVFNYVVAQENDPPTITKLDDSALQTSMTVPAGTISGNIDFKIGDVETAIADLKVEVLSGDTRALPQANIKVGGAGANRFFYVLPNGSQNVTAPINIVVTDKGSAATTDGKDALSTTKTITYNAVDSGRLVFGNNSAITIRDNQTADPYPYRIAVPSTVRGLVGSVSVTLHGYRHLYPDDVTAAIESPSGKRAILFSNAGGSNPGQSITEPIELMLDISGAPIPDAPAGPLTSGIYSPAKYSPDLELPGGVGSTAGIPASLDTFNQKASGNTVPIGPGDWLLYIVDDTFSDDGAVTGGVSLAFKTAPWLVDPGTPSTPEATKLVIPINLLDSDSESDPTKITVTATIVEGTAIIPNDADHVKITGSNSSMSRALELIPVDDMTGDVKVRLTLNDGTAGDRHVTVKEFIVKVIPTDDPPEIRFPWWTETDPPSTPKWQPDVLEDANFVTVNVEVRDKDSDLTFANASVNSNDATIVPNDNDHLQKEGPVTIPKGTAWTTVQVKVKPAANRPISGTATPQITFSIRDASTTKTASFIFPVKSVNDLPQFNPTDYTFANFTGDNKVNVGQTRTTATFRVSDVETDVKDIQVLYTSSNEAIIPTSEMQVAASGDQRNLTFRAVGNVGGTVTIGIQLKDGANELSVEKTFQVEVAGPTPDPSLIFTQTGKITVPGDSAATQGKASPYPSILTVGGLLGDVFSVEVILDGIKHAVPDDLDVVVVHPDGTGVIVLSDAGGTLPVENIRLQLADGAPDMRDDGPMESGTFKPANFDSQNPDLFPDATITSLQSTLSAFKGKNPNGDWKLFVMDDAGNHVGEITKGWGLRVRTTPVILVGGVPTKELSRTYNEDGDNGLGAGGPLQIAGLTFGDPDALNHAGENLSRSFTSSNGDVIPNAGITLINEVAGDNGLDTLDQATLQIAPVPHGYYNNPDVPLYTTYTLSRGDGASWSLRVRNIINPLNDDPMISRLVPVTIQEGQSHRLTFRIVDNDYGPLDNIRVEVTSLTPAVVENSGIRFEINNSNVLDPIPERTLTVVITPKPGITDTGTKTATIQISAVDKSTLANHTILNEGDGFADRSDTDSYVLTVVPRDDAPAFTSLPTVSATSGQQITQEIKINDPDTELSGLTVTAKSADESYIKSTTITVTRVAGQADTLKGESRWIVRFTPEINVKGTTSIDLTVKDALNETKGSLPVAIGPSRARRFQSTAGIQILDYTDRPTAANPYPSTIETPGLRGDIASVRVEINGLNHAYPDDVDIVLVGPSGDAVKLLSDIGGSQRAENISFIIADSGEDAPDTGPLVNGAVYKPTDREADTFPNNVPSGPFSASLAVFIGKPSQGAGWRLYVTDDTRQDAGTIASWAIIVETRPDVQFVNTPPDITIVEDGNIRVPFNVIDEDFVAGQVYEFELVSDNSAIVSPTNLTVASVAPPLYEVRGIPQKEAVGSANITVKVKGKDYPQFVGEGTFKVTTTILDDPPFITPVGDRVIEAGALAQVAGFDYGDAETPKKDLIFRVESTNAGLIPTSNIYQVGNALFIIPAGTATGDSRVTLSVEEPAGLRQKTNITFNVTVQAPLHYQQAKGAPIVIANNSTANPYPSTITVSDVKGTVSRVTVSLSKFSHPYPADVDVLLVGPNSVGVKLMSDVGGGQALSEAWFSFADDASAGGMPVNPLQPITSGTWRPTDSEAADTFPAPAPVAPTGGYPTTLSAAFGGINPNGEWKLFIVDDTNPDGGDIEDWVLNIYTDQPSIRAIADQVTAENAPVTVQFEVNDPNTPLGQLVIDVRADRASLVKAGPVQGTGTIRTVVLTPEPYQNGATPVVVEVFDGTTRVSETFNLTITPVNYAPVIGGTRDLTTPSNRIITNLFTVVELDLEDGAPDVGATLARPNFGTLAVVPVSGGTNFSLVFTPAGEQGASEVVITADDGVLSNSITNIITVTGPRSLVVSPIEDQVVTEGEIRTVLFTISDSDTGVVTVTGSSTNTALVNRVVVGGNYPNYTASIVLNPGVTGTSEITIHAVDNTNAEGETSFGLTVGAGNRPPVFGPIPPQRTPMNVPLPVTLSLTDPDTALGQLAMTWSTLDPTIIRSVTFGTVGNSVVATVRPQTGALGTTTVTLFADDGATKVGQSFAIEVYNEGPQIDPIAAQSTKVNVPVSITLGVRDVDTPLADLVFSSTTTNPSLVSGVTVSTATGAAVATVNLVANAEGTASITIKVSDGVSEDSETFTLSVVDEPPVLGPISDQTGTANSPVVVPLVVSDPDTALEALVFTSTTSNTNLVAGVSVEVSGDSAVATIALVEDATGIATITLRVSDGRSTASQTFALQVLSDSTQPDLATPTLSVVDGVLTVTVTWDGSGELEYADDAVGPWVKTGNTSGSFSEPATHPSRIYRVVRQ